jgi:HK97 gp10 family phage protein
VAGHLVPTADNLTHDRILEIAMSFCKRLFLLASLALTLLPGAGHAAVYYVSPRGDDRHTGRGPADAQALRTVQAGVNRLQPGDTLCLRGGVYRETVTFPRSGAPGRPITLKPFRGEQPVLSGCDPVSGWTGHEGRIWKAPMAWTLGLGRNQLFAGGQVLLQSMERRVPRDTGNLAKSLSVSEVQQDGNLVYVDVGLLSDVDGETARYGTAQEFGTSKMAAQPYVRPAFDEDGKRAKAAMRESLKERGTL